jgi:hypothetical protein
MNSRQKFQGVAGLTAALLVSALLMQAEPASAANIRNTFSINVINGPGTGTTGTGFFDWDDAAVPTTGGLSASLSNGGLLGLSVTLFGQTFTAADDINQPQFPTVSFLNHIPQSVDIIFSEVGLGHLIAINEPGIARISIRDNLVATPGGAQNFSTTANTTAVPTPALLPGLVALGMGIARKRQRQAV